MSLVAALLADTVAASDAITTIVSSLTTEVDPTATAIELPTIVEYAAIFSGAISGGLAGCAKRLDILGVAVLAMVTGLGGGLIRDVILPTSSVYMLDNPFAMLFCIVLGLAAFFFAGLFYKLDRPIAVADIVSVALFAALGADKALMAGYGYVACVFLGTITAVGGGMLRDICLARVPSIFETGNFYAICALAGTVVYVGLVELHCSKMLALALCVAVVIALRWASLRYDLVTVTPVDLTPRVMGPLRRAAWRLRSRKGADATDKGAETDVERGGEAMVSFREDPSIHR